MLVEKMKAEAELGSVQTVRDILFFICHKLTKFHPVLCGRWETYPREFAKCRRCRKAKYCGKECQSTAWSEGHRFWCSAKDPEDDGENHNPGDRRASGAGTIGDGRASALTTTTSGGTVTGRAERRAERERERHRAMGTILVTEAASTDTVRPFFRANAMTGPTITLAALNGRTTTTTTTTHTPQFEYFRLLNHRPGHEARATSPDPPMTISSQRMADTVAGVPQSQSSSTTNSSSDLPAQLRPYLIGPPPTVNGSEVSTTSSTISPAGPSRPRTSSPFRTSGAHRGDDVDMIVS
jgi:MYND finger